MRVRALYNDGRVAVSHRVTVGFDASGLAIMGADDRRLDMWPADAVRLAERPTGRSPFRICHTGSAARLTFAAPVIESVAEYFPAVRRRGAVGRTTWLHLGGWAAGALVVAIILLKLTAPLVAQFVAAVIPDPAKARLGTQLSGQMVAAMADRDGRQYNDMFCYDEASAAALQRLFAILAQGRAQDVRFGLLAVDSSRPELFALPGGQIIMSGALPGHAGGAEALAGSMAHEIGHVAFDHPTRTLLLLDPIAVLFSLLPLDGSSAVFDASLADQFLRLGYREADEEDADAFVLELLNGIGIVAAPYAEFRAARLDAGKDTADPIARMHPVSEDGVVLLREGGLGRLLALDAAQWDALRQMCR